MSMHGPRLIRKGEEFVECYHGCDCGCHEFGGDHIVACCYKCPKCQENIAAHSFQWHLCECHGEIVDQNED